MNPTHFESDGDRYCEFKWKINALFREVRKQTGGIAKQNFMCCGTCAVAEMPDGRDYIFYHQQGTECLREYGLVYLHFSKAEFAAKVVGIAERLGLDVEWDGTEGRCIGLFSKFARDAAASRS